MTTLQIRDPNLKTKVQFFVRWVQCQRESIGSWPNSGKWRLDTKELVTEGPFETYRHARRAALIAMCRDVVMPGTVGVFPKVTQEVSNVA